MFMGVFVLCTWLVVLFLVVLAIDRPLDLPSVVRGMMLLALIGFSVYQAWRGGWRLLKNMSLTGSALKVDKLYSKQSLFVSGVQFAAQARADEPYSPLADITVERANEASADLDPVRIVPFDALAKTAVRVALLYAVMVAMVALNMPLFVAGLTRVFTPWRPVHYPTRTVIELARDPIVVKEGDRVEITARISGDVPATATLALKTGKGKPHERELDIVDNRCEYHLASAFRSFDYRISAGDAMSDWQTVRVISAPRPEKTRVRLVYPDYMARPPDLMEAMTLTVPEGTRIEWELTLDRAVRNAFFSMDDGELVPLDVGEDGLVVTHQIKAAASGTYTFSWVEKAFGFSFKTARHYLQVAPDQAPQVELVSPSANLFATVGRQLDLAYRVKDDHGIGDANMIYRRGKSEEKSVPFSASRVQGRAVQPIDWDYREVIKELAVGDDVTFAVEVCDRYPGPGGPHCVRSESRRMTFLSKDDYLTKVREQKERLLAQLLSVYRQERAAYAIIRRLVPTDEAFEQTCFLESARQTMLAEQMVGLEEDIVAIIADLKANRIEDESGFGELQSLHVRIHDIANQHVAEAGTRLSKLAATVEPGADDVSETAKAVNTAARELSSLVVDLGVREAMDVFAMELHVMAEEQNVLRIETVEQSSDHAVLAARQTELATWIDTLLVDLSGQRDYSKAPLMIVRLARMVKDLRAARIALSMQRSATLLDSDKLAAAASLQDDIVDTLFELECRVRVGAAYDALLDARELFGRARERLDGAGARDVGLSLTEMTHMLTGLYRDVRLLIMPPIPAPGEALLDSTPNHAPPVDRLIAAAQHSLEEAIVATRDGKHDIVVKRLGEAVDAFSRLNAIVDVRLDEVTKVARYAGHSGMSMNRVGMIRELFASQLRLSEKTEDADYDETSGAYLAPSQLHLSKEVLEMRDRMKRKNQGDSTSPMVTPIMQMLETASAAMAKASPELAAEKLLDAIGDQDDALEALQGAMRFAKHEADGWLGLANLIMTAEGISRPAKFMRDVVAEQRDLIAATKASTPESRQELLAIQRNLAMAVLEVSLLLDGTGSALDFEQAILFAGSDMGSSVLQLEAGNVPAAMQAQEMAVASVSDLSQQFDRAEKQFYYVVMALEFLQARHTDGVVLVDQLGRLTQALKAAADTSNPDFAEQISHVARDMTPFSLGLVRATGRPGYGLAAEAMAQAVSACKAEDAEGCADALFAAEAALKESMDELRELVSKVATIPIVEPIEAPPEFNTMMEMVDLLLQQKAVAVAVYDGASNEVPKLVSEMRDIESSAKDLLMSTDEHPFIVAAGALMAEAIVELETGAGKNAYAKLHASEAKLRQCMLEYALYYVDIKRANGGKRMKRGKSRIVSMFKLSNTFKAAYEKDWGGVEGDDPEGGRSEWEVLGRRDRAALNENFVRELPLEYREFLKDYYERLAR